MSPLSSFLAGPFGAIAGGVAFVCGFVFTALKFGAWWHDRKLSMQQADEDRQLFLLKELVALDERRLEQMRRQHDADQEQERAAWQATQLRFEASHRKVGRVVADLKAAIQTGDAELAQSKLAEAQAVMAEIEAEVEGDLAGTIDP